MNPETLQELLHLSPFQKWLGLKIVHTDPENAQVVLHLPFSKEIERIENSRQIHGGAISTLIDTAGVFAVLSQLPEPVPAPTIDIRVDYLAPANSALTATASIRKRGKSNAFVDINVEDTQQNLIAIGRALYKVYGTNR